MDREKDAACFTGKRFFTTRGLTLAVIVVFSGLVAAFSGCKSSGGEQRTFLKAVRPVSDTTRLVRNATYLRQTGRMELAVKELEEAHLHEPGNLKILDALIQCYEELGHFKRAQELYKEALNRSGPHPALENNRCYSLYLAGRLGEAEAGFRELLTRHPENQTARNNLGLVLTRQGRETEALALWREALGEDAARERLGQALAALGRAVPPNLAARQPPSEGNKVAHTTEPSAPPTAAVREPTAPVPEVQEQVAAKAVPAPAPTQPEPSLKVGTTPSTSQPHATSDGSGQVASVGINSPTPPKTLAPKPSLPLAQPQAEPAKPIPEPAVTAATPAPVPTGETAVSLPPSQDKPTAPPAEPLAKKSLAAPAARLNTRDLAGTRIEVKNGNGVQGQARELRSHLALEGFYVVGIGNHIDFGLEETTIAYRPEGAQIAKVLAQKFLPGAKLEEGDPLSEKADIRVSLGRDRSAGLAMTHHQPSESIVAAAPATPTPIKTPKPPTPAAEAATITTPRQPTSPAKKTVASTPPRPTSPPASLPDFLTTRELTQVRIEIKNGNGVQGQARELRSHLALEGFTVVGIGNHIDFGLKQTSISYRPEAARIAKVLAEKFLPGAKLEEGGSLSAKADVRVSLGRDRSAGLAIAHHQPSESTAAAAPSTPSPTQTPKTPAPAAKAAPAATPRQPKSPAKKTVASTPLGSKSLADSQPDFLTVQELAQVRIEIKNGNGVQGQAREVRSRLSLEGFTVVGIGNHIDFGLKETIISYRPEAVRMAKALAEKFFPGAKLEEGGRLSPKSDVSVSLGKDLIPGQDQVAHAGP